MAMRHGGNLRELARRAGLKPEEILDFSASINPLGPPDCLRPVLARSIDGLVHYPDLDCTELVALLADRHGVEPEQVVVGNGSTEILFALARAIPFSRALVPAPSYVDYATAVQAAGREVRFLTLEERMGFGVDWRAIEAKMRGPDETQDALTPCPSPVGRERGVLVLLGQPNNPTGRAVDEDALCAAAARHPEATLVVDEAFADFIGGYRSLAGRAPANVIAVRSLTKFYAIPGLRLGYAVANPLLAGAMRSQIPPWSVNGLAQAAAVALLSDDEYARQSIAFVSRQRCRLAEEMAKLPGLFVYPSVTNFLLVRLDRDDLSASQLAERLLHEGIAVRTFTAEQHLDERFFRVAVRTEEENRRLCDALAAALGCGARFQRAAARPRHVGNVPHGRAKALMIQGTTSNAGKSVLTAALCRILLQDGVRVAPFKSQNMSLNSFVVRTCGRVPGGEMGRAQVVQAQACRLEPDVRMNPVLLKPNSDTGCQVIVRGRPVGNMRVGEYVDYKPRAFAAAKECYDSLAAEFDAIILEGAGSPGEVNLKSHDIVNMRMAEYAGAPVLVAGDIDRGGVFASFVGTMEVLASWERKRVAGWIVNRFRGDASLLEEALDYTLQHTGRPVLGVVPYLPALGLPEEDSVEFKSGAMDQAPANGAAVEIAVIDLPHISNFTDFDAFRIESDVRLRIVRSPADLNRPDAVIIPGSKNTLGDLEYLRRSGLAERIATIAREGTAEIAGICGGFQILGHEIRDPLGIESSAETCRGLGLLGVDTTMAAEKTLVRTAARHEPSCLDVVGYEIHHGQTTVGRVSRPVRDGSGEPSYRPAPDGSGEPSYGPIAAGCVPLFTSTDGRVVGAASDDQRIWGTYLHGVFDADPFRRWFIDRLRARRGLSPVGKVTAEYDIEPALDRLAETVRASLRMDEIYRLLGLR